MEKAILSVKNIGVSFQFSDGEYKALEDISFSVYPNEVVGIVGESGCGKSLTSQTIMGILPKNARRHQGEIDFQGEDILQLTEKKWQNIRGNSLSMIFQEPMTALNPLVTVGKQISEVLKKHTKLNKKDRKEKTIAMMKEVGLPRAGELYKAYPHQLSGGMRQRIVIAIALIADPKLIIADEPTTALDVTIQAQILELFKNLKQSKQMSMIFISHDFGVIRNICDRVMVMYAGRIVEEGTVLEILENPKHPYTKGLIQAIPDYRKRGKKLYTIPGRVPPLRERKAGCPFIERCPVAMEVCAEKFPKPTYIGGKHLTACHYYSREEASTIQSNDVEEAELSPS